MRSANATFQATSLLSVLVNLSLQIPAVLTSPMLLSAVVRICVCRAERLLYLALTKAQKPSTRTQNPKVVAG